MPGSHWPPSPSGPSECWSLSGAFGRASATRTFGVPAAVSVGTRQGVTSQQSTQIIDNPAPKLPAKPDPLRRTDQRGLARRIAAIAGPAARYLVAVSAPLEMPSRTILPNGHLKFIVFYRDASISDRGDVRIVAKIAREFSAEAAGKKLDEGDGAWVIRNVSLLFRSRRCRITRKCMNCAPAHGFLA
jgi:hypothetical protein